MDPLRRPGGIKDVLILGGIAAVQAGFEDGKEGGIHRAALTELADSFEGEVTPLMVDVDGKVVQLTGSAEAQYAQWRLAAEGHRGHGRFRCPRTSTSSRWRRRRPCSPRAPGSR